MKALVYTGNATVRYLDVDASMPGIDEVSIRVLQAGICGTDMCVVRDERPKVAPPMILGHEFIGQRLDTGERVIVNPILSCKMCRACTEGRMHLCEHRLVLGVHRAGAFAETISVPTSNLVSAGTASLAQAAMVDPIATALHAFRLAPFPQGPVAVLGAGAIGLSTLFVLKHFGVVDVTVTDIADVRLELAARGGANRVGKSADGIYDVVYDTAGTVATRRDAMLKTRAGGTAVLIGLHSAELSMPAGPLIGGERTLRGSFGYTDAEFVEAAALVTALDTSWVHTIKFEDAEESFNALLRGRSDPSHVKIQMQMPGLARH